MTAIRSGQRLRERLDALEPPTLVGRRRPPGRRPPRPLLDGADTFPDLFDGPSALPPSPALAPEARDLRRPCASPPSRIAARRTRCGAGAPQLALAEEAPGRAGLRPRPPADPGAAAVPTGPGARRRAACCAARAGRHSQPEELIARTSRLLEEALGHFGIEATVTDTVGGPRVTRYELQLAPGTKVGRITALRDDLAYALAAREELRIIAPIPGKQAVGVEVPNPEASLVTLGDITASSRPTPAR